MYYIYKKVLHIFKLSLHKFVNYFILPLFDDFIIVENHYVVSEINYQESEFLKVYSVKMLFCAIIVDH